MALNDTKDHSVFHNSTQSLILFTQQACERIEGILYARVCNGVLRLIGLA